MLEISVSKFEKVCEIIKKNKKMTFLNKSLTLSFTIVVFVWYSNLASNID